MRTLRRQGAVRESFFFFFLCLEKIRGSRGNRGEAIPLFLDLAMVTYVHLHF